MKKKFNIKFERLLILATIVFSFALQYYVIPLLPEKYFYDSNSVLLIANGMGNLGYYDASYMFAGNFFRFINIFNYTTFEQWSYFLTLIVSVGTFINLKKYKNLELYKIAFIYVTIVLANIYVYRIGKDFIQLLIWLFLYFVINSKKKSIVKKILILMIFLFEAMYFRSYYIAIGGLCLVIYYFFQNSKKINVNKIVVLSLLGIFMMLTFLQFVSPNMYYRVINVRYTTNANRIDSVDAVTVINDVIKNSNNSVISYMLNYFINILRILFPIELISKGVKYFPFVVYQIYFSLSLIFSIKDVSKRKDEKELYYLSILMAYLLVANLFEPDFGSLIRHEVCLYFIIFALFFRHNRIKANKEE